MPSAVLHAETGYAGIVSEPAKSLVTFPPPSGEITILWQQQAEAAIVASFAQAQFTWSE